MATDKHCRSCGAELTEPVGKHCPSCGAEIPSAEPATPPVGKSEPPASARKSEPPAPIIPAPASPAPDTPSSPSSAGHSRLLLIGGGIGLAVIIVVVAVILISGSSSSPSTSANTLPSPKQLPASTVAFVTHVSSSIATLTSADLTRAMLQTASQQGLKAVPTPGQSKYKEVEESAIGTFLDSIDIQGQAEEMGITVTPQKIDAGLAQIKKENFKSQKQFETFAKTSHFTTKDDLARVKLKLLSEAIQARISQGIRGKTAQQEAFTKFVSAYARRWRSRTVCAPQYAISRCSNGPPIPSNGQSSTAPKAEAP